MHLLLFFTNCNGSTADSRGLGCERGDDVAQAEEALVDEASLGQPLSTRARLTRLLTPG